MEIRELRLDLLQVPQGLCWVAVLTLRGEKRRRGGGRRSAEGRRWRERGAGKREKGRRGGQKKETRMVVVSM